MTSLKENKQFCAGRHLLPFCQLILMDDVHHSLPTHTPPQPPYFALLECFAVPLRLPLQSFTFFQTQQNQACTYCLTPISPVSSIKTKDASFLQMT